MNIAKHSSCFWSIVSTCGTYFATQLSHIQIFMHDMPNLSLISLESQLSSSASLYDLLQLFCGLFCSVAVSFFASFNFRKPLLKGWFSRWRVRIMVIKPSLVFNSIFFSPKSNAFWPHETLFFHFVNNNNRWFTHNAISNELNVRLLSNLYTYLLKKLTKSHMDFIVLAPPMCPLWKNQNLKCSSLLNLII